MIKKVFCVLLCVCLSACLILPSAAAAAGDVDGDGAITQLDARMALRRSVDLETFAPGSAQFTAADYDGDGTVTAIDARAILRLSYGLDPQIKPPAQTVPEPPTEPPTEPPAPVYVMPSTAAEILRFYADAAARVKNGEAGYSKKSWQTVGDLNITGIAIADNLIKSEVGKRMTPEDMAETKISEKGTNEARDRFPACTLTDASKIKEATCVKDGDNYRIRMVLANEDSPRNASSSFLAQITDTLMFKDEVDKEIAGISAVKDPDYQILYEGFTIECVVTPDGRFVSVSHHNNTRIHINSAKVAIVTIKNKDASITADTRYTDFRY
ncbi:MAG: hypothetical protein IJK40_07570 [Clostridia bacterium]|nr:hypothetical protein [Clostridia bacterium]